MFPIFHVCAGTARECDPDLCTKCASSMHDAESIQLTGASVRGTPAECFNMKLRLRQVPHLTYPVT